MAYGTPSSYGNQAGIIPGIISGRDEANFFLMKTLINACTVFDGDLTDVGHTMIDQFRAKTGGQFENPILNNRVSHSSNLIDYLKNFGKDLDDKLQLANDNIDNVTGLSL